MNEALGNEITDKGSRLILIRHGEVDHRYRGVCYGQSDIGLSPRGEQQSQDLVERLADVVVTQIVHSGLTRTQQLAELLSMRLGVSPSCCEALKERHYGDWELKNWDEIFAEHGDDMNRLITEPATYRPSGGETTYELRDRVVAWYQQLHAKQVTIAVTHGGPIAALLGTLQKRPVAEWLNLIPDVGSLTVIA